MEEKFNDLLCELSYYDLYSFVPGRIYYINSKKYFYIGFWYLEKISLYKGKIQYCFRDNLENDAVLVNVTDEIVKQFDIRFYSLN